MASAWDQLADRLVVPDQDPGSRDERTDLGDDLGDSVTKKRTRKHKEAHEDGPEKDPGCIYKFAPESVRMHLEQVPQAFVEPEVKPYKPDPADDLVPKPGFVSDFVNLGRATETPTIFLLWGALWTLSAALNRNAWIEWYPKPLWPNLYVLFVAPPGLCKKSTPIDFGQSILKTAETMHPDTAKAYENSLRFLTSKGSPEGLYMMLKPEQKTFIGGEDAPGKIFTVRRSSKVTLAVSELATFLGKQQYNTGLVNLITDLYDCKEQDSEVTRGRGIEPLEKIYVTMAGAITPTGLEESIPEEALGGGLVSRTILVYQDTPTKVYSRPTRLHGYPTPHDLGPRLGWIQANCRGEYQFTPEAEEFFETWYQQWKQELITGLVILRDDENRKDTLLRKIAMLMRVQEYRPGNEITTENLRDAMRLLEYTQRKSGTLLTSVGAKPYSKNLQRILAYIQRRASTTRRELLNRFGKDIRANELTAYVNQLQEQGLIRIVANDKPLGMSTGSSKETYFITDSERRYD